MDQRVSSVRGYNPGPKQAREDLRGEGPGGTLQEGARAGGRPHWAWTTGSCRKSRQQAAEWLGKEHRREEEAGRD